MGTLCRYANRMTLRGCTDAWLTCSILFAEGFFSVIEGFTTMSAALCVYQTLLTFLLISKAFLPHSFPALGSSLTHSLPSSICCYSHTQPYPLPLVCSCLCPGQCRLLCLYRAICVIALNNNTPSSLQWYFLHLKITISEYLTLSPSAGITSVKMCSLVMWPPVRDLCSFRYN